MYLWSTEEWKHHPDEWREKRFDLNSSKRENMYPFSLLSLKYEKSSYTWTEQKKSIICESDCVGPAHY